MRPDRKDLEALARAKSGNKDLAAYLKKRRTEYHVDVGQQRDEVTLRWAQGRLQELNDLIEALETAAELLEKAR
jgi:hypothetical protein